MHPPEIVRVSIAPLGMVNCHIILGPEGCVLVDTGLPGSTAKVAQALHRHGRQLADIKLIVVTHAQSTMPAARPTCGRRPARPSWRTRATWSITSKSGP
jgi:hypothetical protein